MSTLAIERPTSTLDVIAAATRLDLDTQTRLLYWLTGDGGCFVEDLLEAARWRDEMDTLGDHIVGVSADLVLDEPWWPLAIDRFQTRAVITTVIRTPGWIDAHL